MKIHLHKNATTTPAQRAFIQTNPQLSMAYLAERTGVSQTTIRRWRNRTTVFDRPHTPKRIETVLTPLEELKVILCRLATRSGLDDLHQFIHHFMDIKCSRASLNRCLKRYHISRLPAIQPELPFELKDYSGTYFYYTRFYLPPLSGQGPTISLHAILDCSFRFFHVETSLTGLSFLSKNIGNFPLRVLGIIYGDPVILTHDHDFGPSRDHAGLVEGICREKNMIAHHLKNHCTETLDKLKQTCVDLQNDPGVGQWEIPEVDNTLVSKDLYFYNTRMNLRALKQKTPHQAMQHHYNNFPNSFNQNPNSLLQPHGYFSSQKVSQG